MVFTARSTLTQSGPIYGSNKSVWELSILDRNTWNYITVQIIYIKNSYLKLIFLQMVIFSYLKIAKKNKKTTEFGI